ncbi:MAG: hydrogenase maturation protease [Armatimonadota bacterium]
MVDAIYTGAHPPGTILELDPADLETVDSPSPHYTGLPEMLSLANQLKLDFPPEIKILAIEVVDPFTVGFELSQPVQQALPEFIGKIKAQVLRWEAEETPVSA